MSRTATLVKNRYDTNFKHKRQEYGYLGKGVCIEIGWRGVFLDILSYLKGGNE